MVDWRIGDTKIYTGKYPGRDMGKTSWRTDMQKDILIEFRDNQGSVRVGGKTLNFSGMEIPETLSGYTKALTPEETQVVQSFLDSVVAAGTDPITNKPKFTRDQAMIMISDLIAAKQTAKENKDQATLNRLNGTDLAKLVDQLNETNYFALNNDDKRIDVLVKLV